MWSDAVRERMEAERAAYVAKMTAHFERVRDEDPSAMRRIAARFALATYRGPLALAKSNVWGAPGAMEINVLSFVLAVIIVVAGTATCLSDANLEPQHYVVLAICGCWGVFLLAVSAGGIFEAFESDRVVYEAEYLAREAAAKDE
jgi:hypothetical protein